MSSESSPTRGTVDDVEPASTNAATESATQPWVSRVAIIACIVIFLGLIAETDPTSWETVSRFGYLPPDSIWNGAYWALVSSVFVHFTFWHAAFNVYWLWVLGSCLERAIGSWLFLGFFVASAFLSSSFQLAMSGDTGYGLSGVVYAIFGFMWLTRHRYSQFRDVLGLGTIRFFLVWLVGCIFLTYANIWEVGNAAHVSGLLFGSIVARCFVLHRKSRIMLTGLVALVGLSIVPLFWCPWSVGWLGQQAHDAHVAGRYEVAIDRYGQIIQLDPYDAWAYLNRSRAYQELGDLERARADWQMARTIDPSIEGSP